MHLNPQLFKVSIIQTKLFGPLDFELSRFHCIFVFLPSTTGAAREAEVPYKIEGAEPVAPNVGITHRDTVLL